MRIIVYLNDEMPWLRGEFDFILMMMDLNSCIDRFPCSLSCAWKKVALLGRKRRCLSPLRW